MSLFISSFEGEKFIGTELELGLVTKFRVIALKIKQRKASVSGVTSDWNFHDCNQHNDTVEFLISKSAFISSSNSETQDLHNH